VTVKPSASNPLDSLVDLACRDGVDVRPTLLRVVTDLYVQKPNHSAEEETQFVELALGLIEAVDHQTRSVISATLAGYPGAPAAVLEKLAGLDTAGAGALIEAGQNDLTNLFFSAPPDERRLILVNLDVAASKAARRVMPVASELIRRLQSAALNRNRGEFSRVLERALGVDRDLAEKITADEHGEPIVVAARAIGMKLEVLQRILLFLNPVIGQSAQRIYKLSQLFEELSAESAEFMLTIWQTTARRRSVHATVCWNDERPSLRPNPKSTARRAAETNARPACFKINER
jgi:hypothetical protein